MTSTAITDAPASCSAAINRPTTSRRHGHCPTVARLRSSTFTITTPGPGVLVPAMRSTTS